MSEIVSVPSEQGPSQAPGQQAAERDLSRPYWQRSVGYVLMNELADQFFEIEPYPIGEEDIDAIEDGAKANIPSYGDMTWARAAAVAAIFPKIQYKEQSFRVRPAVLNRIDKQVYEHTFFSSLRPSYEEGMDTMFSFPLKLAKVVSDEARKADEPRLIATNMLEIAGLLRREDMQGMVHQAAFTKNDIWARSSASPLGKFTDRKHIPQPLVVVEDGTASFAPAVADYLIGELREVNKAGLSRDQAIIPQQPSSGCPVRHERAHFRDTQEDWNNLAMLGKFFDKTIEELLRPRDETAITKGMNYTADLLEQAHPLFQDPNSYAID